MRKITKRSAAIATAAVIGVGAAGAAWAAWQVDTDAQVQASAGSAAKLVVTAQPVSGLYPGAKKAVTVSVANPNDFPVKITTITGPTVTVDGNPAGCKTTGVKVIPTLAAPITLQKNLATTTVTIPDAIEMTNESETGCQGQTFRLNFTLVGQSA